MEFAVGPIVSRSRLASWLALAALRLPDLTRLIIARLFRLQRDSDGVRFLSGLLLAGFPSRFRCSLLLLFSLAPFAPAQAGVHRASKLPPISRLIVAAPTHDGRTLQ
jgi:hypothetical protein